MTDKKRFIWIPLFWGSAWGLAEATLGHSLHRIPIPGVAGYVMFPLGMFFMVQVFQHSGKLHTIFLTALVAASIKLVDLFLPTHPFTVINPSVAILCESLAVCLFFAVKDFKKILTRLDLILGMALVWRLFYGILVLSLGFLFSATNFAGLGSVHILRFFLLDSSVNAILIFGLTHKIDIPSHTEYVPTPPAGTPEAGFLHHIRKHPALTTIPLFLAAIVVELILS